MTPAAGGRGIAVRASAVALALLWASDAGAQAPTGGPEILLNVTTAGEQTAPAVAREADGGYIVAWRHGTSAVAARRLDPAGAPRGPEIAVNILPTMTGWVMKPAVAAHPTGGFVVVWEAPDADGAGIKARRFDASGQPAGGEILLNTSQTGPQTLPRIGAGPLGYVAVWTSGSGSTNTVARMFDQGLVPRTGEIVVGPGSAADVAVRPDGWFLVARSAWRSGPAVMDVNVRFFDPAGTPVGSTVVANSADPGPSWPTSIIYRDDPRIALGPSASFVVAWHVYEFYATGGLAFFNIDHGSYFRRFEGTGAPLAPQVKLNTFDPGWQQDPAVAVAPAGAIVAGWTSEPSVSGCVGPFCFPPPSPPPPQDGSGSGVYARTFDAAGNDTGGGEFPLHLTTAGTQSRPAVVATDGAVLAAFDSPDGSGQGIYARRLARLLEPIRLDVDPTDEVFSDGNGVFENWEAVVVAPAWRNTTGAAQAVTSVASGFTGPAGPTYTIVDASAGFGVVPNGATVSCLQTGDCFGLTVYGSRPAVHWDAQFTESVQPPTLFGARTRTLHIGGSFADVPRGNVYYRFIETVFHNGVMTECAPGSFCPLAGVTREAMALSVLKAVSPGFTPPACVAGSERFLDVPASSPYCRWIEELARRGVVAGCGNGNYCPLIGVSRETMAVYLLLTKEGSGYVPPACTAPAFADVPASSPFCRWIAELARRGIVGGCGGGNYCPFLGVGRDQMSVFLGATFGLLLYAP
jgi:hypothetical protein